MSRQRKAPTGTISGPALDTTWRTPGWIRALAEEYFGGQIPFDVATAKDNPMGAAGFWTEEDDALSRDDWPPRVWCNPPYGSDLKLWLLKFAEQARRGVEIVSLPSASRFEQLELQHSWGAANALCLIRKRVRFLRWTWHLSCGSCGSDVAVPEHGLRDALEEPAQDFDARPATCRRRGCRGLADPYLPAQRSLDEVDGNPYATLVVGYRVDPVSWARTWGMAGACYGLTPLAPPPLYLERRGQRAVTRAEGEMQGLVGLRPDQATQLRAELEETRAELAAAERTLELVEADLKETERELVEARGEDS